MPAFEAEVEPNALEPQCNTSGAARGNHTISYGAGRCNDERLGRDLQLQLVRSLREIRCRLAQDLLDDVARAFLPVVHVVHPLADRSPRGR